MAEKIEKIVIVFKTHFDIGFTKLSSEVLKGYGENMLPDVVATCEATAHHAEGQRFVWTMSSWPLLQCLKEGNTDPEVIVQAEALLRDGKLAWHALPYTTHTEFCGLEEWIRGLYVSEQLSSRFGHRPVTAKMTDVPGHTWIVPSLLAKEGVKFLHLGCNPFSMPPDVPQLFWWEGPDGSRVLTFYNKGEYGSSLTPPEDWPLPFWLAFMQTGDNIGPQSPEVITDILNKAEQEVPEAEIHIGTMDDFAEMVLAYMNEVEEAIKLPVVRGDLADSWIHGVGTYPREVSRLRRLRAEAIDVEKAYSLARATGVVDDQWGMAIEQSLGRAYEQMLLFGEHTWGLDIKHMGENRHYEKQAFRSQRDTDLYRYVEQSWDEQRERVRIAELEMEQLMPQVLNTLASAVEGEGEQMLVFNGLGWKRDGLVPLTDINGAGTYNWIYADTGELVDMVERDGKMFVQVKDVPACGYRTLQAMPDDLLEQKLKGKAQVVQEIEVEVGDKPDGSLSLHSRLHCSAEDGVLENDFYRIQVDLRNGVIKSLYDKRLRYEWVASDRENGMGQYRYDIYGDQEITEFMRAYAYRFYDWALIDYGKANYPAQRRWTDTPENFTIEAIHDKDCASLVLKAKTSDHGVSAYGNVADVMLRVTLYVEQPYIDLEIRGTNKEETSFVESGHICLPLNLNRPRYAINKLGSVVDPAKDIPDHANHVLYCCENWINVSDGERGMTIIPFDTPLCSIGDVAMLQHHRSFSESEPTLYFNWFNNVWGTNFPQWIGGDHKARFRFIPHAGDWRTANIDRLVAESVNPLLAGYSEEVHALQPGNIKNLNVDQALLPNSLSVLEVIDGIELVAWKPADDGQGYILRIRESRGMPNANAAIKLRLSIRQADVCSLTERIEGPAKLLDNKIIFATQPFEVHTFRVQF